MWYELYSRLLLRILEIDADSTNSSTCRLSSTAELRAQPLLRLPKEIRNRNITNEFAIDRDKGRPFIGPPLLPVVPSLDEELKHYCRIRTYKTLQPIMSFHEAERALQNNENDARANQFLGWWYLSQEYDPDAAIHFLKNAAQQGRYDH
jgi:hypothetical protein